MLLQLESTETNVTTNESEHESLCYYNKYIYIYIYLINTMEIYEIKTVNKCKLAIRKF